MLGLKDSHIKLLWILSISLVICAALPIVAYTINPDKHSSSYFDKSKDPSLSDEKAFADASGETNPDASKITSTQIESLPGSSFKINWYKNDSLKYTTTIHYGYVDSYGTYHQDSLPAPQTDTVSKECMQKNLLTSSNLNYGSGSSFFNVYDYIQTINYNNKYYSFSGCYFGQTPDNNAAYKCTKMTFRYDNSVDGEFYYINELDNDGTYWKEDSTDLMWANSTVTTNKNIYITFKEQAKNSSGQLDGDKNGFYAHWKLSDGSEKKLHIRYAHKVWDPTARSGSGDWVDEYLPSEFAGDVYIAPFNNLPSSGSKSNKKFINIFDYAGRYINYNGNNYVYDYAQCCNTGNPKADNPVVLNAVGYQPSASDWKWCWATRNISSNYTQTWNWNYGDGWNDSASYFYLTIYYNDKNSNIDLYTRNKPTLGNQIVDTVDSAADGVDMKLFDYSAWNGTDAYYTYTNSGFNKGSVFKFSKGTSGPQSGQSRGSVQYWFNQFEGKYGYAVHDIFGKLFDYENNNPVLKDVIYNGKDSSGNSKIDDISGVAEAQKDLNRLFDNTTQNGYKKNIYNLNHLFTKDSNGYYEYNSYNNFAQLPKYTNNAEGTTNDFVMYNTKNDTSNARFMPFDSKNTISDINRDYLFGITMEFDFNQPTGGKIDGSDMIFNFAGDDDVMVYIDGVQVLNLAGLHQSLSGEINFSKGEVTQACTIEEAEANGWSVNNAQHDVTHSFKDLFQSAGKLEHEIWDDPDNPKTFLNGSRHNLKFIYFERGRGDSNCHMKFNIPPVPEKDLEIGKETATTPNVINTGQSGESAKEKEYGYYVEKYNLIKDAYFPYSGTCEIYQGAVGEPHTTKLRDGYIDQGVISLKQDEVCVVKGFWTGEEYGAYELLQGITTESDPEKWGVNITGDVRQYTKKKVTSGSDSWIAVGCTNVNFREVDSPGFQFNNNLYLYNLELRNDTDSSKTVKVMFGDTGIPYTGNYKRGDTVYTTTDGIISFDAGETILIENIEQDTPLKMTNASRDPYDIFVTDNPPEGHEDLKITDKDISTETQLSAVTWYTKYDPTVEGDNLSRLNFKLEGSWDLILNKTAKPTPPSDMTFDLGLQLFDSEGNPFITTNKYNAIITHEDESTTNAVVAVDNGAIKIVNSSTGTDVLEDIILAHKDSLSVPGIVPPNGYFIASEKTKDAAWPKGMLNDTTSFSFEYFDGYAVSDKIAIPKLDTNKTKIDIENNNVIITGNQIYDTFVLFVILLTITLISIGIFKVYKIIKRNRP